MNHEFDKAAPKKRRTVILVPLLLIAVVVGFFLIQEGDEDEDTNEDDLIELPSIQQINEILSGSLALVEAQHAFYTHVKLSERYAGSVSELRFHKDQGTVMVSAVWHASDAVPEPVPVHGYLYTSRLMTRNEGEKDGFVITAFPADQRRDQRDGWPVFLSIVPNSDGGIIGMSSRETWEIANPDAAVAIRSLFSRTKVSQADLAPWSPDHYPASTRIKNFNKKE